MLTKYLNTQPIATKILLNSIKNKRSSHAYLFETNGCSYANKYILDFVKHLVCPTINEQHSDNCSICRTIDEGNYPELKIINPDGQWIKKEQLQDLQQEFNTKAIIGTKKIYIINGADKLNASSANSILKFLEEPEENIVAILVVENMYNVMQTILSRCQIISLQKNKINQKNEKEILANSLLNNDYDINQFIQNEKNDEYIKNAINFINFYEEHGLESIIYINSLWNKFFNIKEKEETIDEEDILTTKTIITPIDIAFNTIILYYKDIINFKTNRKIETFVNYESYLRKIANKNTTVGLCNKLEKIIEIKNQIKYNINKNLLMDKFIISLEEVKQ